MNKGVGGHQEVISNCSKWKRGIIHRNLPRHVGKPKKTVGMAFSCEATAWATGGKAEPAPAAPVTVNKVRRVRVCRVVVGIGELATFEFTL